MGAFSFGQLRHDPLEGMGYTLAASTLPVGLLAVTITAMLRKRRLERNRPHEHYVEPVSGIPGVVLFVGCCITALAAFSADAQKYPAGLLSIWERHRTPVLWIVGVASTLTLLGLTGRHLRNEQLRATIERQPHVRVEVGEEEITFDAGSAMSRIPWASIPRFSESAHVFLLYTSAGNYHVIPKKVMTAAQIQELRQMLLERAHPPTGGFPVVAAGTLRDAQ